jgi:outer membrane protein assembly factor BamB
VRLTRTLVLTVAVAAVALSGCSTVAKVNPFKGRNGANKAAQGGPAPDVSQRIPLLALDQQLKPADALKGVAFKLPVPQPLADCPVAGCNVENAVENVDAAPKFQVAWRRDVGKGSARSEQVMAPPIMVGGHVFTMDGAADVSAFDARTGQKIWSVDLTPKNRRDRRAYGGGLAFSGGRLFVSSGYRFVASLDPATGAVQWKTPVAIPFHAAPVAGGGKVFVANINDELISFDAATGVQGWQYQALTEQARLLFASSPVLSGDTVIAAFASGEVSALRTSNGNELWSGSLTRMSRTSALSEIRDIAGRPVVSKGAIFAGSHAGVFGSVDLRTGDPKWQLPISTMATPWVAGDAVYVVSKAGEVVCVNRETGQVYWITDLNQGRRQTRTSRFLGRELRDRAYWTGVVLASNRLITVSSTGQAAALDPKTGAVQGYLKLGSKSALLTPMAVNGYVYVLADDGKLIAID